MKKICFLLLLLLTFSTARAYHIAGGDLSTRYLGPNTFEVTLTLYRDCSNPIGAQFDPDITLGIFGRYDNSLVDTIHMNLISSNPLNYSGPGCISPPQVCMEIGKYIDTVNLPNLDGGYYMVWERCCRNNTIINLTFPDQAGMTFYCSIPNPAIQNSSPVFTSAPLPYVCANAFFRLPFSATDADGDSLVYQFVSPYDGGHSSSSNPNPFSPSGADQIPEPLPYSNTNWQTPYSLANICGNTQPLVINSETGLAEGATDNVGIYAMAVSIWEYRNGVFIGEVRREIEITAIECSGNASPALSPNVSDKDYEIYTGDSLCFNINATDANGDSLFLNYYGEVFQNTALTTIQAPYAISYDTLGQGSINTTFCWYTSCDQARDSSYHVTYEISDNGCPIPLTSIGKFRILVKPSPIVAKPNLLCMQTLSDSTIRIYLGEDPTIMPRYFRYFTLYRSVNGGAYQALNTFNDPSNVVFDDSTAQQNNINDYCYYITGTNSCGIEGPASDTLCSVTIEKKIVDIISVSVSDHDRITIKWKDFPDGVFSSYHLMRKKNEAGSNYAEFATLTNYSKMEYTDDEVYTNESSYCYKIYITDYCKNDQPESEEQCSILLTGNSAPFEHNLKWNNYINWKQNVNSYTIERAAINEGEQLSDKYVNLGSDTLRTDNDLPLNDGIFGYRIRAKENSGGNDGESYSNIIELTQNPILYAPNAFSPNGDNDNETWGVERAFVKDYSIDLYNRWGQLIFQSTNTQERWDGTFKGTAVPQGVYFYKMRFTGYNDRKVFEKLGSITVVR